MNMPDFPTFNYRTVYFFWLSLFGIVFILSLIGQIKVKFPGAFLYVSFVNIFISVFTWIYQIMLDNTYTKYTFEHKSSKSELKEDFDWYIRKESINLMMSSFFICLFTLIAIIVQFIE